MLFRTWTDGYSYQGQLKNSKWEFPWSCSMTSGNVEFPLWTFTQRRRANSRTNWPGEPNVQMISLSELLHETRLRVKPVEQRAKVWVLVGGYRSCSKNRMDRHVAGFSSKVWANCSQGKSYFLQLRLRLRYFVLVWTYLWSQCAGTLGAHHFTRHGNPGGHLLQDYTLLEHIQLVCVAGGEWDYYAQSLTNNIHAPMKNLIDWRQKSCVCLFRNMFCNCFVYTFILWHVAAVVVIFVEYLVLFVAAVAFNIEWSWKWPRVIINHHELPSKRPFFFNVCLYTLVLQ